MYFIDEGVRRNFADLYGKQYMDLRDLRDTISKAGQKEWVTTLMDIVYYNNSTLNNLQRDICHINQNVVSYARQLAQSRMVTHFDENMCDKFADVVSFASNFVKLSVSDGFLNAKFDYSVFKSELNKIGHLNENELNAIAEILTEVETKSREKMLALREACLYFSRSKETFVDSTRKLFGNLRGLHSTIGKNDLQDVQKDYMKILKVETDEFSTNIDKLRIKIEINLKIHEINRRMKSLNKQQDGFPGKIQKIVRGKQTNAGCLGSMKN